jgi:hypothetical protein
MGSSKKPKKPSYNKGLRIKPHQSKDVSDEDRIPKFSFRLLQADRNLSNCNNEEKVALIDTIHRLSQIPWKEIRKSHRHGLGCEKINHNAIRLSIPNEVKNENILAMRFYGKAPIIGFRKQATFYILWIDRNCDTYKH